MRSAARAAVLILSASVAPALAHHPGSHAARDADGGVRLEVVVTAADACTSIAQVRPGAPPGIAAVPGSAPVTARLQRPGGACAAVVTAVRAEERLDLGREVGQILLYVVGPDGAVASTERVPVR